MTTKTYRFKSEAAECALVLQNSNIIKEICIFLPLHEIVNFIESLYISAANFIDSLKELYIKRGTKSLKNKLIEIGWTQELFDCLKESGAIIAGSFPLQHLLGVNWEGSDIDIFSDYYDERYGKFTKTLTAFFDTQPGNFEMLRFQGFGKSYKKYCATCHVLVNGHASDSSCDINLDYENIDISGYITYLEDMNYTPVSVIAHITVALSVCSTIKINHGIKLLAKQYPEFSHILRDNNIRGIGSYLYNSSTFDNSTNYESLGNNFDIVNLLMNDVAHQIITFKDKSPREVVDTFDYGFCKVYFDGETIHVVDWDSVSTKTTTVMANTRICRKHKYEARGFTIIEGEGEEDDNDH